MTRDRTWDWAALLVSAQAAIGAGAVAAPPVVVSGAWARASAPGQTDGVAYLSLTSAGDDVLTGAACAEADMAMLHLTSGKGGMEGMSDVDHVDLPAGKTVSLAPHGLHLMLMGLKHRLTAGGVVHLDLTLKHAGTVHVTVPVANLGASGPPG